MPINNGMLLGMIKQLDKRIKVLEDYKATEAEKQVRDEDLYWSSKAQGESQV